MKLQYLNNSTELRKGIFSFFVGLLLLAHPFPSASASDILCTSEPDSSKTEKNTSLWNFLKPREPIDVNSFLPATRESTRQVPSLFLSEQHKVETVEGFVKIVGIKSPSGSEAAVRKELKHRLVSLGFSEIALGLDDPSAPLNLIMELLATKDLKDKPAIILNAHMDTIQRCTPEEMDFDAAHREFFHKRDLSFGADDKAGVMVILSALKTAKTEYWDKGIGHRKIVVVFTAQEERRSLGARHLTRTHPEIFEDIEITLMTDGPLNYRKGEYPENSFIIVVDEGMSRVTPFSKVMTSIQDICGFKDVSYITTRIGLGQGDLIGFPAHAKGDLHIRAPYQGNHSKERVKLDDLFNHIDLFTYILLRLDGVSLRFDEDDGRLHPSQSVDKRSER
jgi:putative aminopeptidase FrvX